MSGADTGLGIIDQALVETLWRLRATEDGASIKSSVFLRAVDASFGISPDVSYDSFVAGVEADLTWIRLFGKKGNLGSRGWPPASPRYTEVRLSPIGEFVAGHPDPSRLPIGFINGNAHREGELPPFDPFRVFDAIEQVVRVPDMSDAEIVAVVGEPSFQAGCTVAGDIDGLHRGDPVDLQLTAQLAAESDTVVVVSHIPPPESPDEVIAAIAHLAGPSRHGLTVSEPTQYLPIRALDPRDLGVYALTVSTSSSVEELIERLQETWGVRTRLRALLPAPTATLVRRHAAGEPSEVLGDVNTLRNLVHADLTSQP